jgi:hypothetical protein
MDNRNQSHIGRRGFVYTVASFFSGSFLAWGRHSHGAVARAKRFVAHVEQNVLEQSKPVRDPDINCVFEDNLLVYRKGKDRPLCTINEVGKAILDQCDGLHTPEDMARFLCRKYQVSYDNAYEDCLSFLAKLKSLGAIRL